MLTNARLGLLVAGALAMTSRVVVADTLTENCTAIGTLARSIMEKRQNGVDMSEIMSRVENIADESFKPIAREMAILAYSMPLFNGEEFKQRQISEFGNQVQVACYQGKSP